MRKGVPYCVLEEYGRSEVLNLQSYMVSPTCWAIFIGCFAATTCLTPLAIRLAHRLGAVEGGGYRKIHHHTIARLGGLAVALPVLAVALACTTETAGMFRAIGDRRMDLFILVAGGVVILVLGVLDDVRGVRARHKLLVEIMAGLLVALSGNAVSAVNLPLVGVVHLGGVVGVGTLLTVLWVVGITNAVNIIDGLDGLASGVGLIAAATLAVIAGLNGSPFVVLLDLALIGSLLAFLRYNWHPAKVFLGDTGSLFIGYTLATVSLMGSYKSAGAVLLCSSVMALGIPIFETLLSMVRRYLGGFPLFCADSNHTHHRLLRRGLSQRQTATILYAAALGCMVAAILGQVVAMESAESLIPVTIMVFTLGGIIAVAGYTKSLIARYGFRRDTMRFMALARYAAMSLESEISVKDAQRVLDLMACELGLLCLGLRFASGRAGIASTGAARDPDAPFKSGETMKFNLKAKDGSAVEVSFQYAEKAGSVRHAATSACLASAFDGLDLRVRHEPESPAAQLSLPFSVAREKKVQSRLLGRVVIR